MRPPKFHLALTILIFSNIANAQLQKPLFQVSFGAAIISSDKTNNSERPFGAVGSIEFSEYFKLRKFSLGTGLNFSKSSMVFVEPYGGGGISIPELKHKLLHKISALSLEVPLCLLIPTDSVKTKGVFFRVGTGIKVVLSSKREVEYVSDNSLSGETMTELIVKETFISKTEHGNSIGLIGIVGIGKFIQLFHREFAAEIQYKTDLTPWNYNLSSGQINSSFSYRRPTLSLNLAFQF